MLRSIGWQSSVQRRVVGFAWFHASVKRLQRGDYEGAPLQLSALNDVRELKNPLTSVRATKSNVSLAAKSVSAFRALVPVAWSVSIAQSGDIK